jgi:hypothetical protein
VDYSDDPPMKVVLVDVENAHAAATPECPYDRDRIEPPAVAVHVRSATAQFRWFASRQESAEYLARVPVRWPRTMAIGSPRSVASIRSRRARARSAHAYAERAVLERFRKVLSGEWPPHGPIVVRVRRG